MLDKLIGEIIEVSQNEVISKLLPAKMQRKNA